MCIRLSVALFICAIITVITANSNSDLFPPSTMKEPIVPCQRDGDRPLPIPQTEFGNLEGLATLVGPRDQPPRRFRGLFALVVDGDNQAVINEFVTGLDLTVFSVMLFHDEESTASWLSFPWYSKVIAVQAKGQGPAFFFKRFLHPSAMESFDYIFLWDKRVVPGQFNPVLYCDVLDKYKIDISQPAQLVPAGLRPRFPTLVHNNNNAIGRWVQHVSNIAPVFSRRAWRECIWPSLQFDLVSGAGYDLVWQRVCGARGLCRTAVIDAAPVTYVDHGEPGQRAQLEIKLVEQQATKFCPTCTRSYAEDFFDHGMIQESDADDCSCHWLLDYAPQASQATK